jgi:alpha-galactosidase
MPSGLIAPAWWGEPSDAATAADHEYWDRSARTDVSHPGGLFRGDALAAVGVAAPRLHPDQLVLYRVVAED